ncbi:MULTISPECIES: AAA family ATPase [unclassified Nodularia (in: cyanobacteria)]|uniref:AAA family ATPase n=1 Tax=unclassified Nodularia (in: cyanobacteria) TaxID=2656917 RepID=UPI0018829D76|nr:MULTISPECIES: AAA family ATPase [unclassified Nodularia (in: cyanobacteria)]MBE9200860.1 AAA family ATPase [Nodularia sp. LEGE 06071]MCC2692350.1 AAA family ATPase [Nodularia sp. LEGE 04288]
MLLGEHLNSSQLKSFSINGLFGFKDVKIPFDKEAVILIAENGSGKTTILNALYYSISCKFHKLSAIDFNSIGLEFASGVSVEIKKNDLKSFYQRDIFEFISLLRPFIPSREIEIIRREIRKNSSPEIVRRRLLYLIDRHGVSMPSKYYDILEEIDVTFRSPKGEDQKSKVDKIRKTIQDNLNESILYFPTYRRIEEDLKSLGYEEEKFERLSFEEGEDKLIQFGMDDVIGKFNEIKTAIRNSALNLFSKVMGEILTQFLEGIEITQDMRDSIQPDTLNIVLSRVGEKNISKSDRKRIEKLVSSGEINSPQYDQLVYFLSKLVGLYEQQKEKDDSINQFATICNKYLNKKRIIYDEANVDISIIQTRNNSPIDIKNLSSGEKQIISLFSKIYLESSEEFILLFDEPELSLSLEWQKLLLPDILKSGKCRLLLAVTHSPFIFDNELDFNANDLDIFVREE